MYYSKGYHFASRFISESETTWYHNEIITDRILYKNKNIELISDVDIMAKIKHLHFMLQKKIKFNKNQAHDELVSYLFNEKFYLAPWGAA